MGKLNGMATRPYQNPDEYVTEDFQQRDKLEHIGRFLLRRES